MGYFSLIAPEEDIGLTSRSNPTFFVELSDLPPTPLIVSITQSKVIEPLYYQEFIPKKAGRLEIETKSNLSEGEYILTIGYFCQRDPDQDPIYLRVVFEKKKSISRTGKATLSKYQPQATAIRLGLIL
jgi:hypothetical protein